VGHVVVVLAVIVESVSFVGTSQSLVESSLSKHAGDAQAFKPHLLLAQVI
jgi:hypothetical protein